MAGSDETQPLDGKGRIIENGIVWEGSRESLEAWKKYKRGKAASVVQRGYSVRWYPDGEQWMEVFIPERRKARLRELAAQVYCLEEPSPHGIDGGRVSKLQVYYRRGTISEYAFGIEKVFNYDRGVDVDRLDESRRARRMHEDILDELN